MNRMGMQFRVDLSSAWRCNVGRGGGNAVRLASGEPLAPGDESIAVTGSVKWP